MLLGLAACGGGSSGGGSVGSAPTNQAPIAAFVAGPTILNQGQTVNFQDNSFFSPTQWEWDFGNNGTVDSTVQNPSWVPPTHGFHSVRLTVHNSFGSHSTVRVNYIYVNPPPGNVARMSVDADRDGQTTQFPSDNDDKMTWDTTKGAIFYFNLDDDSGNNQEDYKSTTKIGNDVNDLARVIVRQMANVPSGGTATITIDTNARGKVRIYRLVGSNWNVVYNGSTASFTFPLNDLLAGDVVFGIEGKERLSPSWDGFMTIGLEIRESSGTMHSSDQARMRQAPPIYATNLWTATELHVVQIIPANAAPNQALIAGLQTLAQDSGIQLRLIDGANYQYDRWLQDSSEPGVTMAPMESINNRIYDFVYQAYRMRPVDMWCRNALLGPSFDLQERFGTLNSSMNYGGNIEVVPPHGSYPWGRMLIGGGDGFRIGTTQVPPTSHQRMDLANRQYFASLPQGPHVEATVEWLAVGHIDEISMFMPANNSRGWACLIASPTLGFQVLQQTAQQGGGNAVVFNGRQGYQTTVNALLNDTHLVNLNNLVQARINQARDQIIAATGMSISDFIEVPVVFENVGGNEMAALNPGVCNCMVLPAPNGTVYFAVPDPEGPRLGNVDQWQLATTNAIMALTNGTPAFDVRYYDVFNSYHRLLGELHCGTNTVRTPPAGNWWNP
jgi:protein-arginine deiminase